MAREIRTTLYGLGKSALNQLIADIENGLITEGQQELSIYKTGTGRLYFAIDLERGNEIIDRAVMVCGIETEATRTMITDVRDDYYEIETYGEDTHDI